MVEKHEELCFQIQALGNRNWMIFRCILSVWGCVRRPVCPSVRRSVGTSVRPSVRRQPVISNAKNERFSLWKSSAQSNIAEYTSCAGCAYCTKYAHGHIIGMLGLVTEDLMLTQCWGHSSQMVEEPCNLWLSTHIWCKMQNLGYFLTMSYHLVCNQWPDWSRLNHLNKNKCQETD